MAFSVAAERLLVKAKQLEAMGDRALAAQLRAEAEEQALNDVFGRGWKRGRNGEILEQGIGAAGNPHNHISHYQSLEKAEGKLAADAARERDAKYKK